VDQFGSIQPIGGVNEKIEGFFACCKMRRLTGEQGVMIPRRNVKHLMLDNEVIEAVRDGKFSIWAIDTVDEGIEILTGVKAGRERKNGTFTPDSVHDRVKTRLRKLLEDGARLRKKLGADSNAAPDKDTAPGGDNDEAAEKARSRGR
jgi:predicted ATP-dependent protease